VTVRATERSVLTDGYDRILVPTDGSECAALAIDHGLAVGEAFDATIHALYVVDTGTVAASSDAVPARETLTRLESQGEEATEAVAERARDAGLDAVTAVLEGSPAKKLRRYADENDVDLIAMGTHGRRGFDRFFLGSTTAKTIRHSEIPVLSVRQPEGDEDGEADEE
jgi:nucleotide-binding universal stress UspA family protein